jgi:hypothetical protein
VIVEPVEDLDLAAVGQAPVGEVGLPALVGRGGLEPDPRAAWALAGLGDDEPGRVEDPPDGRGRWDGETLAPEVPGDGDRTGVKPAAGQLGPQRDDASADMVRGPAGVGPRPAGARIDGLDAVVPLPAQEPVQVPATDPVLGCRHGDGRPR